MQDNEGSLDFLSRALRGKEKNLGKTHPSTLATVMNMGNAYVCMLGVDHDPSKKIFERAEGLYRQALEGRESSLGRQHIDTKKCAMNLAGLFRFDKMNDKKKVSEERSEERSNDAECPLTLVRFFR